MTSSCSFASNSCSLWRRLLNRQALGSRNPSAAIGAASLLLPFATYYAIVGFLLGYTLPIFLVLGAMYGFTTAAMLVPALGEYNIAMGRARTTAEEE